jgi:cytosine/uracil/thiamine/allantoin permease
MGRRINSWLELFESLREAFIEVMRAEVRSLRLDFELSKRQLVRALGLTALAIFVVFWAVGVVVFLLIQLAGLWLAEWAAALVVLAVLVLLGWALAAGARRSLRSIEEPGTMVRRHVQEHMDWWEGQVLPASDHAEDSSLPPGGSPPES